MILADSKRECGMPVNGRHSISRDIPNGERNLPILVRLQINHVRHVSALQVVNVILTQIPPYIAACIHDPSPVHGLNQQLWEEVKVCRHRDQLQVNIKAQL